MFSRVHGSIFREKVCEKRILIPIWVWSRYLIDLGTILAPHLAPFSIKNRSKNDVVFSLNFGWLFGGASANFLQFNCIQSVDWGVLGEGRVRVKPSPKGMWDDRSRDVGIKGSRMWDDRSTKGCGMKCSPILDALPRDLGWRTC